MNECIANEMIWETVLVFFYYLYLIVPNLKLITLARAEIHLHYNISYDNLGLGFLKGLIAK